VAHKLPLRAPKGKLRSLRVTAQNFAVDWTRQERVYVSSGSKRHEFVSRGRARGQLALQEIQLQQTRTARQGQTQGNRSPPGSLNNCCTGQYKLLTLPASSSLSRQLVNPARHKAVYRHSLKTTGNSMGTSNNHAQTRAGTMLQWRLLRQQQCCRRTRELQLKVTLMRRYALWRLLCTVNELTFCAGKL
jgi:hypothetical protein